MSEPKIRKTFVGKLLQKIFSPIGKWFKNLWKSSDENVLQFAYLFTNEVKEALLSGIVPTIVQLTNTKADDQLLFLANVELPKIIASTVLFQSINQDTTPEQAKEIMLEIAAKFGAVPDSQKARLYTTICAEVYIRLMKAKYDKDIKFGEAAALSEGWFVAEKLELTKED